MRAVLAIAAIFAASCRSPHASVPVVTLDSGLVRGFADGGSYAYEGIPYAAPPIGPLRWRPAQPVAPWSGVREATHFASMCPQIRRGSSQPLGSEDCLYLNVFTPMHRAGAALPVLFFIHGGGNIAGSASPFDGSVFADQGNAVVVTIEYRLGPLGWLAHPAFGAENAQGSYGDYGLSDQIAALAWVRRNIGAFGGDPTHVLVFGQSAGAIDVCALVTSPRAAHLFSAAILESGPCDSMNAAIETATATAFARELGCGSAHDVAACLRSVPLSTILHARGGTTATNGVYNFDGAFYAGLWWPTQDPVWLPLRPLDALARHAYAPVPLVIGTTTNEADGFVAEIIPTSIRSDADYQQALVKLFGAVRAQQVAARYPGASYASPTAAFAAMFGDYFFQCPTRRAARAAAGSPAPVHRYLYTHVLDRAPHTPALHSYELGPLWNDWGGQLAIGTYHPDLAELALGAQLRADFLAMAATGDPTGPGSAPWPPYDAATDPYFVLDERTSTGAGYRTAQCDFWDGFDPR